MYIVLGWFNKVVRNISCTWTNCIEPIIPSIGFDQKYWLYGWMYTIVVWYLDYGLSKHCFERNGFTEIFIQPMYTEFRNNYQTDFQYQYYQVLNVYRCSHLLLIRWDNKIIWKSYLLKYNNRWYFVSLWMKYNFYWKYLQIYNLLSKFC